MRRDSIFLLLPASICALVGITLITITQLELISLSTSSKSNYFIGGSLIVLSLILFIASFTTPLSSSKINITPEETELFNKFKIKYKKYAYKTSFINLAVFILLLPIGTYLALFVGLESTSGTSILLSTLAAYIYITWVLLPKLFVYECPSCNMDSLSCTVLIQGYGANISFLCRECNLEVDWHSGIIKNPNKSFKLAHKKRGLDAAKKTRSAP